MLTIGWGTERIIGKTIQRSPWLGQRSAHFAETHEISNPTVLGAAIDLTDSLNLVQTEAYSLVAAAYDALKKTCKSAGKTLPKNGGLRNGARYLDCAVFETLHLRENENEPPFSSVRAFFLKEKRFFRAPVFEDATISKSASVTLVAFSDTF